MKCAFACVPKSAFTDAARTESLEAFDDYHERSEQAASRFLECLEAVKDWLSRHPKPSKPLSARTRRYLMKTFPFVVIDRIAPEALWIIGVVHEKRDPSHWQPLL